MAEGRRSCRPRGCRLTPGVALAALAALAPTAAGAQAYQCAPPQRIEAWPASGPDGPPVRSAIAGYTLAVSWAPEFCRQDRLSFECSGANGRFGFVVHGLWPEAASGASPQWCAARPRPSTDLIRRNLCMAPVASLAEHEWAKHGTCMAPTPEAYYGREATLWQALRWPDGDRLSRQQPLTVGRLRAAIALANPAFKPEWIGVLTGQGGWMRELRLCYSRRFKPAACPRARLGPSDATPLKIWRGL